MGRLKRRWRNGICFDMPIDFPSAGPFVWGMGDLKDALAAAGYGGEE